jgi:hypothetical protein
MDRNVLREPRRDFALLGKSYIEEWRLRRQNVDPLDFGGIVNDLKFFDVEFHGLVSGKFDELGFHFDEIIGANFFKAILGLLPLREWGYIFFRDYSVVQICPA